jgi:porin
VFYRFQLTEQLAITPDIQYLVDPALDPDEDNLWVFGLRARLAL